MAVSNISRKEERKKKMCQIVTKQVADSINFAVGFAAIVWSLVIYGENKGRYPSCDKENLEVWYLIYSISALAVYPAMLFMATIVALTKANPAAMSIVYCLMCLLVLDAFFLVAWWIVGNVWIWNSNCGDLTTQGRNLLIYQYCSIGFLILLGCCTVKPEGTHTQIADQ